MSAFGRLGWSLKRCKIMSLLLGGTWGKAASQHQESGDACSIGATSVIVTLEHQRGFVNLIHSVLSTNVKSFKRDVSMRFGAGAAHLSV